MISEACNEKFEDAAKLSMGFMTGGILFLFVQLRGLVVQVIGIERNHSMQILFFAMFLR